MSTVTVEIGHTYAPDRLVPIVPKESGFGLEFADSEEAEALRKVAESLGDTAIRVALVDDIELREIARTARTGSHLWRAAQLGIAFSKASVAKGTGANYEHVYYESEFEQAGRGIVAQIQSTELPEGYRLSQDGRKLKIGSGRDTFSIPLQGFKGVEDSTHPSCQVLDLAWLQKRLTIAPEAITVLPSGYDEQQRGVEMLADLVGVDKSLHTTVFYDSPESIV